ncbi:MAG: DUF72 domain-containing protein [Bryobacterales bacterium]|nr:DUF72 domain-containing protein [Bryobacterales bacterium]
MSAQISPQPLIFPSDWQHPDWTSAFYGEALSPSAAIEFLSGYFDATELRSTQWEFPRPELMAVLARKASANPRFRFNPLLHRRFTHDRMLDDAEVKRFCEGIRPLADAGRLGVLVMQFPWSFKFTEENKQAFLALRRAFGRFPLVAEFRHASWQYPEALGLLIDYKVGYVNPDLPEHIRAAAPSAELTSPIGYFRFHGRRRDLWDKEWRLRETRFVDEPFLYTTKQLQEWQSRIERVAPYADACYVAFTNDAEANSAVNAMMLRALSGEEELTAPEALVAAHSYALDSVQTRRPVQRVLLPMTELRHFAASA